MCTKMNTKSRCGAIRRRKSISINMQSNDGGDRATEIFGMNFSSCIHGRSQVPVKRCSVHTYRKISFKRVLHNECDYNVPCFCERRGKFKYEKCTHEKKSCRKSNKQQTHSHVIHVCLMEFFFGDFQSSIMHQPTHFHIFTFFLQKFPLFLMIFFSSNEFFCSFISCLNFLRVYFYAKGKNGCTNDNERIEFFAFSTV